MEKQLPELYEARCKQIIMLTKEEIDSKTFNGRWSIGTIGDWEGSLIMTDGDYRFYIKAVTDSYREGNYWLHFGHPSGAAKRFAVASPNEEYSVWRIFVNDTPNTLSFQFANDGVSENRWWLACNYGRIEWDANGSTVQGGILEKAEVRDGNDAYQRFRIDYVLDDDE